MEIEAKYRATKRIRARDVEAADISPYLLGQREVHQLRDTLLDTPNFLVRGSRHSLRLRVDNGERVVTLKGAKVIQQATHIRRETEHPLGEGEPLKPETWHPEIGRAVHALTGDEMLVPLMTISNRRRSWAVFHNGKLVAEVALDRGAISYAGASEKLHELEIELKGEGSITDLEALSARFTAALPLEAEARSKAQRAWELRERVVRVNEALERAAEQSPMRPDAPLAEAARSVLARNVAKLHAALPIAEEGSDPEGVHQCRVATRRLRAILAELAGVTYTPRLAKRLRRGLRALARTLGVVRDADVFLMGIEEVAAQHDSDFRAQMEPLTRQMHEQREAGRAAMLKLFRSRQHRALLEQLVAFVTVEGAGVSRGDRDTAGAFPSHVRDFAGSRLWSRYEAVRAYESILPGADVSTLHRLRIEVKHLRYVLELFADVLDDGGMLRAVCTEAQEHLGALNDTVVALAHLAALPPKEHTPALEAYGAEMRTRQQALYDNSSTVLAPLFGAEFRESLAGAIAKI